MNTALQNRPKTLTRDVAYAGAMTVEKAASGRSAMTGVRKEFLPIERRILSLLADGLSSKGIANHIEIGEEMVKTHFKYMFAIAGVNSRSGLIAWAFRRGLIA